MEKIKGKKECTKKKSRKERKETFLCVFMCANSHRTKLLTFFEGGKRKSMLKLLSILCIYV